MYNEQNLVRVAKRENNTKRTYLVVNRLQGKHVPVSAKEALNMFEALGNIVKQQYEKEKLLLVGFAETATAIGAAIATQLHSDYMQTTREIIPGVEYLFFSEAHSHATEQKLVKNDLDQVIPQKDRIVFIEDEVTTGNTILNIISILEKLYPGQIKFAVASLLNGMGQGHLEEYQKRDIPVHYLVKTNHESYSAIAAGFLGDGDYVQVDTRECSATINQLTFKGWMNARRCVSGENYQEAVEALWQAIKSKVSYTSEEKILVLGTEEYMYPALYVASKLEEEGNITLCHSTTRSPIAVSKEEEYPVHTRYELRSFYDSQRVTFIYDLKQYDHVLILTDSQECAPEGVNSLVHALQSCGNEDITLVRWHP